uniref:Uncharacterized protein LOC108949781 n=1 Tax=Phallusia mammillata TaxID=59560 RepID=A0A6F9DJR3_9ASCI|nr:uncharacterized protein LOC108949781 [Phallusia mammillata]
MVPAKTDEDLDKLLENVPDLQMLAKRVEQNGMKATIRTFIRLFMSRDLAASYSWSGLGPKHSIRKKLSRITKCIQFFAMLFHSLTTRTKRTKQSLTIDDIKIVLSGAADWDNGWMQRQKETDGKSGSLTEPIVSSDEDEA